MIDLFDYYVRVGSLRKTTTYLEEKHGIVRDYQSVRKLLTNEKYIGKLRNNTNYCEPIIDKDVFETVQLRLSQNVKLAVHTIIFLGDLFDVRIVMAACLVQL